MRMNPVKKTYLGTDGNMYRGRQVKARKRLEVRISLYEKALKTCREESITRPGSLKCRK